MPASNNSSQTLFTRFAQRVAVICGRPVAFFIAIAIVIVWAATGPVFHYSDTWQLIINTGTTIVTFLMVFLIQHTQTRDTAAIQIKLSELIMAIRGAENRLARVEDMADAEIEALQEEVRSRVKALEESLARSLTGWRTKPD